MKITNLVSATLTADDLKEVMDAIAFIKSKLPFLLSTTPEQRKSLTKMGDKSQAFVTLALELATQSQDYLPRSFDVEEMRKDVELFQQLRSVELGLTQVLELVSNTAMVARSEAMTAALTVYDSAKTNGQDSGVDAVVDELSQRFPRTRKSKSDDTDNN